MSGCQGFGAEGNECSRKGNMKDPSLGIAVLFCELSLPGEMGKWDMDTTSLPVTACEPTITAK